MNFKSLFLSFCACVALASCSNEEENVMNQAVEKTLTLKMNAPQTTTRAIEGSVGTVIPEVKSATLFFYSSTDLPSIEQKVLSENDIAQAQGSGLHITVPSNVLFVSMAGNEAMGTNDILFYQGLNQNGDAADFKTTIPLLSEITAITHIGEEYSVVLKPKAQLSRIEVSGSISTVPTTERVQQAYEYAKVNAVFCNNYKLRNDAQTLQLYTKSNLVEELKWDNFPEKMRDVLGDEDRAALATTGAGKKCAAYQVFPMNSIISLPHIILEVKYKEVNGSDEKTGYFTINRYRTPGNSDFMTKMEGGYIYKLDISALSSKFQNAWDINGNKAIDPTDSEPEMAKADLTITVEPVAWTEQAIVPGI